MVSRRIAGIDNLQRDHGTASDAIVVGIEAACKELIAATAGLSTVRLATAVDLALEELLVDGAVIDARAAAPFPRILSTVTGAAHPAIVL